MHYKVENIISNSERAELISIYNSIPTTKAVQDYNLFTVDKRIIPPKQRDNPGFKTLDAYAKRKTYSHYFVMYEQGSFTRMHTDNDDEVGLTIVTLLDTFDLVGGETVVSLPYEDKGRNHDQYRKGNAPRSNNRVIPKVVQVEKGQSMVYDKSLLHGVAQVEKGKRLVLVSWYKNETI